MTRCREGTCAVQGSAGQHAEIPLKSPHTPALAQACPHRHTHTHASEEEEEEEMRSPGRAHPLTSPMVPASPNRLGAPVVGGVNPAQHHGCGYPLHLPPWSPDPRNTSGTCCGYHSGSRGRGLSWNQLHSCLATNPPRRVDLQVSALSPPCTAEGRRLASRSCQA